MKFDYLARGANVALHAGRRIDQEGEEAEHDVDDDGVDVAADEGGLQPSSHSVQDDSYGD